MKKQREIDIIVDKSKIPDERTATWQCWQKYPDLAEALAGGFGQYGRVERGWEIKGKTKSEGWLLSMMYLVGETWYHYTQIYPLKRFKGKDTAIQFRREAMAYFKEMEIKHKLN